jgi:hypothetical protein
MISIPLLTALAIVGALAITPLPVPPVITIPGSTTSGYAFGHAVGTALRDRILGFYSFNSWADDMRKLYRANDTVRALVDGMRQRHIAMFPTLMNELDGIADAVGKRREDVFIDNVAPELDQWFYATGGYPDIPHGPATVRGASPRVMQHQKHHGTTQKCTDLLVANENTFAHGHNEDWDTPTAHFMAVVVTEDWTSYSYPGDFVGTSFLFNRWGLTLSMNSIYPNMPGYAWAQSYGFSFLLRTVANARSIREALQLITKTPIYSGYGINILSACEKTAVNIEAYGDQISVRTVNPRKAPGVVFHANEYLRIVPKDGQWTGGDSGARLVCYNAWPTPITTPADIRTFLGDRTCPIWRFGSYADSMCEWIADGTAKIIKAFVGPKDRRASVIDTPTLEFPWNFACPDM